MLSKNLIFKQTKTKLLSKLSKTSVFQKVYHMIEVVVTPIFFRRQQQLLLEEIKLQICSV